VDLIAQGPVGRRWVLLEGFLSGLDPGFTAAADRVRALGFGVVLSHPERYPPSPATEAAIAHELATGSAVQLNAWSFTGRNGHRAQTAALELLKHAPVAIVASDAHGADRAPALRDALRALTAAGVPEPQRLVSEVPRQLLEQGLPIRAAAAMA
jgi:tyrosine-protein phosphatase YwqE